MLVLKKLRTLDLESSPQLGRPLHLSAASGLVRTDAHIYVVADDELSLGVFDLDHKKPGALIPLLEGDLPLEAKLRKTRKPDFESLAVLPPFAGFEYGALLAVGSGSKKQTRQICVLMKLSEQGTANGAAIAIDLAAFYEPLHREFAELNIEGALIAGGELRLFQRGNSKEGANAVICCALGPVLSAMSAGRNVEAAEIVGITSIEIGEIGGLPLSFTDAALLPDGRTIFAAAAENTDNPYDDGPCAGSAIGILDEQGSLLRLEQVDCDTKLEGITSTQRGDDIEILVVSDADDADVAASLFSANITLWKRH